MPTAGASATQVVPTVFEARKKTKKKSKKSKKRKAPVKKAAAPVKVVKPVAPTSFPPIAGTPLPTALSGLVGSTQVSLNTMLQALMTRSSASDPRYFSNGVWVDGSPECFRCTFGPATLAATRAMSANDAKALSAAISSYSLAIRTHQRADGAIVPAAPGEGGPGIQTIMFGLQLANSYALLYPKLTTAQRTQWRQSIVQAARFAREGSTTWYTNGNINLATTVLLDLADRVSGTDEFTQAARDSASFTLNPTGRWSTFGLRYSKAPTRADGSDGAGYLAESGGGVPGFDPAYTLMQSNLASLWYVLTGSPTALRLTNLTVNQLIPLVRVSDWTVDVSGGTRRAAAGVRYPFATAALPVSALWGGRTDLADRVTSQLDATIRSYAGATTYTHAGMSYQYGLEMATALQALYFRPQSGGLLAGVAVR